MKLLFLLVAVAIVTVPFAGRIVVAAQPQPQQYYGGPGGQLSGYVWSVEVNAPIDWAIIRASDAQHVFQTTSGMSGYYLMRLPNGTYTVTVSAPGYVTASTNVTIVKDSTSTANFFVNETAVAVPEFQPNTWAITMILTLLPILVFRQRFNRSTKACD